MSNRHICNTPPGILAGADIHAHDVTPIQGLGMVFLGAFTRALQPGLSHFALTGQPGGAEITTAMSGFPSSHAVGPVSRSLGCKPGLSHFALTGQPEGDRTHNGHDGLPLEAGCKPGMLKPGLQSREGEHTQNSSDRPAGKTGPRNPHTHHALQRPTLPQNPNHPLAPHSLRAAS